MPLSRRTRTHPPVAIPAERRTRMADRRHQTPPARWRAVSLALSALALGGVLLWSAPAWAQTATTPGAPAIESLTARDQAIAVVWTAPASNGGSAITSYDLRHIRSDADDKADDNWTVETSVWTTGADPLEHTLSGLANGTRYDVQAKAVNANGDGDWSATVTATPATVPAAPNIAYAQAGSGRITITWFSPTSDGGSYITSYDLRYIRSDSDDANWTLREDFKRTAGQYRIGGLTNGVAYHVQVRAVNAAGHGAWSQRQTRTPMGPPGIPSVDMVTPGDGSLAITWSDPSSDGGSDITGYNLRYVRNDLVGNFLFVWDRELDIWTSGDALEYTLSGLTNGVRYRVGLQAVNDEGAGGWSDWSNPRTGIAGSTPAAPGAPTIDRATSDGTQAHVRWSAPTSDGGADITGYDLRHIPSAATDNNWTVLDGVWASGALEYTVEALTANVEYDFQLRAENSAGAGSWSATVNNMDPDPPGAPAIRDFSDEEPDQLWVSWRPPADDGGAPPTHYDLRHIRSDATDKSDANWTPVDDLTGALQYTIIGLTSGVNYRVQVRAANRGGDGPWSLVVTLQPKYERPNPPGNISVTPSDGTLTVKWTPAPAKAGVTVAGYKVSYIRLDDPDWNDFSEWTTSGRIASGTLEYVITGLQNGVWYSYDTYSVSSAGRESRPPAAPVPVDSPGRAPGALGELKRTLTRESSISIRWIGPTDDGGHTVTSYDIHYHPTSDPTKVVKRSQVAVEIIGEPAQTNVTWVGNLTPHAEYEIQVRARNRIGAGPWSSLTLIPRRQPVELAIDSVTEGDGTLTVAWTDGGDDEITGYELRYSFRRIAEPWPDSDDWEYLRDITGISPLQYTIDGLVNGRWYQVEVRGRNRYGVLTTDWGRYSDPVSGTPRAAPGAPAVTSVTPGDEKLTVAWAAPADDGGSSVTSYDLRYIRRDELADGNWTELPGVWSSGARLYELFGLTNGVTYDVQVRAVNVVDLGPWSPVRTGTAQTVPGMPSIYAATPDDRALSIIWTDPARTGGFDITSYDVRYIRSDAPDKDDDENWTVRSSVWTSGALEHTRSGLTNGVDYDVQVRAVTVVGAGPWSDTYSGTPRTVPGAPAVSSVRSGDEMLTVAWAAPASNGGSTITSYDLRYIDTDAADKDDDDNWTEPPGVWSSGARLYELFGLTNGVTYDVQVRAVNVVDPGPWSPVRTGTAQTVPGMPSIYEATPVDRALSLAWTDPARTGGFDITSYDVRYIRSDAPDKDDGENWTVRSRVWTSGALEHIRSGLTNGVDYDVQVRAVTVVGAGLWSDTYSGTPRTTPGAPTIDSVTPGDQALTVAWSAPDDTGGSTITGYDLRYIRSDALNDNWTEQDGIWTSGVLRYTLGSLPSGFGYDVQVRAVNVAGDGRWSATVSGTLQTIPKAPTIDSVARGDETLAIEWSAPADDGGSAVTSYDAHYIRSDALNDNWSLREGIWSSGPRSYELDGLTNGVRYDVRLRAVTSVGPGPWSAAASATPQTAPDAPTISRVTFGDRALAVAWSSPADDGGSAITSYDVRYIRSDELAGGNWTEKPGIWTAGVLEYTLDSLTNGVAYDVQVRAVNVVDPGPWSGTVSGEPRTRPAAPAIDSVTHGDGTLTVAWSAPADDSGSAVTSYDVRYIRSDELAGGNWTEKPGVWIAGDLRYTLDSLTNGVTYEVQVRAVNAVDPGHWSAAASDTPRTAPDAPTIDQVTFGDGALVVFWSLPADDGGFAVTSYDVRYIRSDELAGGNWTEKPGVWIAGDLRYTLDSLTNGVTYDVQVRAVNTVDPGLWSGTGSGEPRTRPAAPSIDSVTHGDGTLTVAWFAPADYGGSAVTSYDVRYIRSDAPDRADTNWTVRPRVWIAGDLRYTLRSLTNGVTYEVQVRAVNAVDGGPWSPGQTGTAQTAPGMPSIGAVTPGDRALSITWNVPARDGGFAITSYDLRYIRSDADKADTNWKEGIGIWIPGDLLQYRMNEVTGFHDLQNLVTYEVQVRAVSAVGTGDWSASRTGTPGSARRPLPSSGFSGGGGGPAEPAGPAEPPEPPEPPDGSELFGDVEDGAYYEAAVAWMFQQQITVGCGSAPLRYCPSDPVTRAQMASFLARALDLGTPEERAGFADVDPDGAHAGAVEALYGARITVGCGSAPLRYCPGDPVTRAQMASFLARALDLGTPEERAGFADVEPSSVHAGAIEALYGARITVGCGSEPLRYCPDRPVTRAQMASSCTGPATSSPPPAPTRTDRALPAPMSAVAAALPVAAGNLRRLFGVRGSGDVDPTGVHAAGIDALFAAGITEGCSREPLRFCPARR